MERKTPLRFLAIATLVLGFSPSSEAVTRVLRRDDGAPGTVTVNNENEFGIDFGSLQGDNGTVVDPFGTPADARCLTNTGGFTRIGVGHGSFIDRIRDINLPDSENPPNFIGNLGGPINNVEAPSGMKLLEQLMRNFLYATQDVATPAMKPPSGVPNVSTPATSSKSTETPPYAFLLVLLTKSWAILRASLAPRDVTDAQLHLIAA
ncbi:hypothetical protein HK102_005861 [Quaeritorhiza haematococci]|nr:hypothetical protein HK102_005861 [Quaeritorhiza haematococci]